MCSYVQVRYTVIWFEMIKCYLRFSQNSSIIEDLYRRSIIKEKENVSLAFCIIGIGDEYFNIAVVGISILLLWLLLLALALSLQFCLPLQIGRLL